MIIFHYCKKFEEEISKKEDYRDKVTKKIKEISKRKDLKNIGSVNVFAGGIYILKVSNPKARVIIEEREVNIEEKDIKVFFIRDIISNHKFDNIYGKYLYKKLQNREWLNANPLSIEDINNFKKDYKENKDKEIEKLEFPPKNLVDWIDDFKLELNNEVFETKDWVRYALDNCETTGMLDKKVDTFRILLKEIIKDSIGSELLKEENDIKILKYTNHNIGILYSKLKIDDKNIILLYNGAILDKQDEYWQRSIKNIKDNSIEFKKNIENISRNSYRSYPKWTINNDDLWFAIQKSKEISNLSLTSEQSNFFSNFKFPYYINGQAGSGKSTMLYYLFSNVYFYKTQEDIKGNIVFLTENNRLLDDTKKYVYDLLSNNPEFDGLTTEQINDSKEYFCSFKDFLFNFLEKSDKKNFYQDKYLNFSVFKNLYENSKLSHNIKKKYSAEESWFTIITYIYGNEIDELVTSKDYEIKIGKASRVISLDKFKGIEEFVLPFYEKLINEDKYWDKLKIIKYINENINMDIKDKYSVIICDEAQDFCRVELKFILSMSEYFKYDLSNISQVPVVFAGDPNQTVNPTGFREDEMTSLLYNELKKIKFEYDKESNLYNPSINYRSSYPVVNLANFIQYYRMKELGIKQKKPQEAKRPISDKNRDFNIFLSYEDIKNNIDLKDSLIKKLEHKIFIVPIDTQEKSNYIANSELLSMINQVEVKTSVEAKGAEYNQVVLYGFGEYFLDKFKSLNKESNDDEIFRIGYFFNKLYVGITRAQNELIIIDNKDAQDNFWKKLVNNAQFNDNWNILNDLKSKVIEYDSDSINSIILESTPDNALLNAMQDKKQGEYYNNPARLRVASSQFFKLGKEKEANECLALAEEIKQNYKSASDYFLKSENIEKASMSFFKGRYFDDVEKIGNNLKSIEQSIRIIIGRVMDREILISKEINILEGNSSTLYQITKDLSWRDDLIKAFIILSKKIIEIELKREFVKILKHLRKSTDIDLAKEIGYIYYNLEDYKKAVSIWEEIDFYKEEYIQAKKIVSKKIILQYKKEKRIIDNDDALNIYLSYIEIEDLDEIVNIGKIIEDRFNDNLNKLKEFYQGILEVKLENRKILYLLERWAKIIWKLNRENIDKKWIEELNKKYKDFKIKLPYKEFTKNELVDISKLPDIKDKQNIEHFTNIIITNFRQFNKIRLEDIGQFNLIVGDNNVGKTSILEALLFTDDIDLYLKNLIFSYASRVNLLNFKNPNDFILDIINQDSNYKEFSFKLQENRREWNFIIKIPTEDEVRSKYKSNEDIDITKYICIVSDDKKCEIKTLSLILAKIEDTDLIQTQYIPYGKGFDKDLVKVYADNIDRDRVKRKEFLECMKIFIPNIERITTDTDEGKIYIEEINSNSDTSLHQYGEGAKKLFRILVQILLQKGKKLLIDEIDAGIHYSHFSEFWKVILQVAKKNSVQIFATTHNLECIEYFKDVLEDDEMESYQELSRTITLEKDIDNNIRAYTRIFEEFEYELDNKLEIRGEG